MRLLILTNNGIGLYNFRKELLERLVDEGNQVYLSLPEDSYTKLLKEIGCNIINTNINRRGINPVQDIYLLKRYLRILTEVRPHVVFTYTIKPNIYGGIAAALHNILYIATITGLGTAVENGGILSRLITFMYKVGLQKASCVFFQNIANQLFFEQKGIYRGRGILVSGSGVNLKTFVPIEYPADEEKVAFAFISRIMKEKGIEQYLAAADYIKAKHPNTVFHVCGFCEQSYEARLNEMTKKGIIIYHGMVHDVRTILKDVHCTVHPTYYPEGISNVLLESSACARPIITTDRAGCCEVINDGVNGFIVKQQDSKDLIEKIESFLNLPNEKRAQMGLAGRLKVEREFDREIVVNKYLREIRMP